MQSENFAYFFFLASLFGRELFFFSYWFPLAASACGVVVGGSIELESWFTSLQQGDFIFLYAAIYENYKNFYKIFHHPKKKIGQHHSKCLESQKPGCV